MRARRSSFVFGVFAVGVLALGSHCGSGNNSGFVTSDASTGSDSPEFPGDDGGLLGDVSTADVPVVVDKCHVPPDNSSGNAPNCNTPPLPPNSFTPKTKWTWDAPPPVGNGYQGSMVTPLVANFTDDDKDGEINLCDIPDVIVTTNGGPIAANGKMYMLAGDTGQLEVTFDGNVDGSVNPAIGDVDNDGIPEVVAVDLAGHVVIYDEKGHLQTTGPDVGTWKSNTNSYCNAIAIYDLDADGSPEIIVAFEVFNSVGKKKFGHDVSAFQGQYWCPANTAADLDGDGKLEVIFGNAAYHADGTLMWSIPGPPGQPQVANLDSDTDPEIFIARQDGLLVLEHTGQIKFGPIKPFNEATSPNCWSKPAAVHDFDGDGIADLNASGCLNYGVLKVGTTGLTLNWSAPVNDTSGLASSTAFDFLGRGIANAVYGDQVSLLILDGKTGQQYLTAPRSSGTLIEYPVVADIDNDQSADILVVSNTNFGSGYKHTIEAFQDAQKRWIPTRRIWNQHAYHVTNLREDGTIPKVMGKNWRQLNTFRTNSQIQAGGDCAPPPPNPPK
ncbi:hypothetical protein BH09MYX1_BH09MYX1_35350 [soil metagenome]